MGATNEDSPVKGSSRRRGPQCRKPELCQRLCQKVLGHRSQKTILDNATGQAKMGELVGVLGPSGAFYLPLSTPQSAS